MAPRRAKQPKHDPAPPQRNDAAPQILVCCSDLHAGSTVGLCPPECHLLDDGIWSLNPIQEWLWGCWGDFQTFVKQHCGGDPYSLLVNGDAIEGFHHRTKQVVHVDPGVHARIAADCLKPLASSANSTFIVKGTEAHVGHCAENGIGDALGAVQHPDTKQRAAHHWLIEVNGCLVSAKHHIGTSVRRQLYATQLSVNLGEERLAATDAGHRAPDVVVRSHRHTFGEYSNGSAAIITTPAWQALTVYGWKVATSSIPEIGGVILDWRGLARGALPRVVPFLRKPQQSGIVSA